MSRKSITQQQADRQAKARQIVAAGDVLEVASGAIIVAGSRVAGKDSPRRFYQLWPVDDARLWDCQCIDAQRRAGLNVPCKHALAAELHCRQEAARVRSSFSHTSEVAA
jgi:hypothetical protein